MFAEEARKNVVESFDISEALELVRRESLNGKLECSFRKGDCVTNPVALDYENGLKALGYKVRPYGPYVIKISWDIHYIPE